MGHPTLVRQTMEGRPPAAIVEDASSGVVIGGLDLDTPVPPVAATVRTHTADLVSVSASPETLIERCRYVLEPICSFRRSDLDVSSPRPG